MGPEAPSAGPSRHDELHILNVREADLEHDTWPAFAEATSSVGLSPDPRQPWGRDDLATPTGLALPRDEVSGIGFEQQGAPPFWGKTVIRFGLNEGTYASKVRGPLPSYARCPDRAPRGRLAGYPRAVWERQAPYGPSAADSGNPLLDPSARDVT